MKMLHPRTRRMPRPILAAAMAAALLTPTIAAADPPLRAPRVPADLEVDDGSRPFLIGHAYGTQNYVCLPTATGFTWAFFAPQATLFDKHGQQITTHFLSANPDEQGLTRATWQHSDDTSAVWGLAVKTYTESDFVAPGAIPWLKLQVVGAEDGTTRKGALTRTTFIQRVNTRGGIAPAGGCQTTADVGRKALVPYTADYVFFRK